MNNYASLAGMRWAPHPHNPRARIFFPTPEQWAVIHPHNVRIAGKHHLDGSYTFDIYVEPKRKSARFRRRFVLLDRMPWRFALGQKLSGVQV